MQLDAAKLIKSAQRASAGLQRRRLGAMAALAFSGLIFTWVLWCFPYSRSVRGNREVRTSYGVLRWHDVTATKEQAGLAMLLPVGTVGQRTTHGVALIVTIVLSIGAAGFLGICADRTRRNLRPGWECRRCGYIVGMGAHDSTVCPECGDPPAL